MLVLRSLHRCPMPFWWYEHASIGKSLMHRAPDQSTSIHQCLGDTSCLDPTCRLVLISQLWIADHTSSVPFWFDGERAADSCCTGLCALVVEYSANMPVLMMSSMMQHCSLATTRSGRRWMLVEKGGSRLHMCACMLETISKRRPDRGILRYALIG